MLELKNISLEINDYGEDDAIEILRNVNLRIDDESFIVITGPNGGGKSTLAKIIMGLQKPTNGKIIFNNEDITDLDITERAKKGIGFAFQQPVRFKGLYVRDLLRLAAGRRLTTETACAYLAEVGLCAKNYIDREINASLSGGELKRIEIAMLIARRTKLSIFDEPEAGIDLWSFHSLIRVFKKIRDTNKGTIVIISHQERILDIADKIVVISNGKVAAFGKKTEILPELLKDSDSCRFYREEIQA